MDRHREFRRFSDDGERTGNTSTFVVFSSTEPLEEFDGAVIELEGEEGFVGGGGEILTIEDYVKNILVSFQDKYPDVELSKKLGISRKSLWEKRKKHGIYKKKERCQAIAYPTQPYMVGLTTKNPDKKPRDYTA